jgi:outer membrane receptor for ferrienterochelin and colicins
MKIKHLIFSLCILSFAILPLHAFEVEDTTGNEKNTQEQNEDAQVVVAGTKSRKLLRTAPVKTEVISKKKIEAKGADTVFDALKGEVGVVVENNCQNCAANTVALNGLPGNYTQLLMNGSPSISSLAGVYFLQQAPASMIERIEIVRVGGSALYGPGAIGGVINIISKKPSKNSANIEYRYEMLEDSDTPAWVASADATYVSPDGKSGLTVYGVKKNQDQWDENDDGYSDLPKVRSTSGGIGGFFTVIDNVELTYHFFGMEEFRRGGNKFDLEPEKTDICEQIDSNRSSGDFKLTHQVTNQIQYDVYYGFARTERKTYYGPGTPSASTDAELAENLQYNGQTENTYQVTGADINYSLNRHHMLQVGVQYTSDQVTDENTSIDRDIDEHYKNFGMFAQYDMDYELIEFIAGVRVDKHSELDDYVFSPRASAILKFNKNIRWRSSVSTGFIAPQVFDEDYHIEVGLDGSSSSQHVIKNADDLEEEKSVSYSSDIGFNYAVGAVDFDINLGGFYTRITDKMSLDIDHPVTVGPTKYYYRKNADGTTEVYGGTCEFSLEYAKLLAWSNSLTIQDAEMPDSGDEYMNKMPRMHAYSLLQLFFNNFETNLSAQYLGKAHVQKEDEFVEVDDFWIFGVQAKYTYQFDEKYLSVYAGIDNITNAYQDDLGEGADRPAGYLYGPSKPRTYYAGCRYGF